jgi:hypothetical protein
MYNPSDAYKSTRPSEMKKSEDVQRIMQALESYINPFTVNSDRTDLFCVSSGQQASEVLAKDFMQFVSFDERDAANFIQSRLTKRETAFHETNKKLNLKTFASMAVKQNLTTTQKKTIQVKAERNLPGHL